jgi:hypothetical protein
MVAIPQGPAPVGADDRPHQRLGSELEAALLRALLKEWASINWSHLGRSLRPPTLLLSDAASRLGQWSRRDRTIELGRRMVAEQPWGVVVEVLKHEMAHQYADEVLGALDETAHGTAFRIACRRLAIDPAASGLPAGSGQLPAEEVRVLGRIAKLLALADSPNRPEAESAMREAQRLMLKYNLDAVASRTAAAYSFRHLGEPSGRIQGHQRQLAHILGSHFFVEPIWITVHRPLHGKPGTVLEVCGTPANLEMAAHVHDFLLQTAERLWRDHRRQQRIASDQLRRSYLVGVMRGFEEKLATQARENQQQGLVWVADAGLRDFLRQRYPRQQLQRTASRTHPAAYAAGQQAGRSIILHRPVGGGSSSSGSPRLLPGSGG